MPPINKITREYYFGLDISDSSLEAVWLEKKGRKKFRLISYSRFRLSPGIIEDGYILQPDKLKEAIKKMMALGTPRPIKIDNVFIAIPESRVFIQIFSFNKDIKAKDLLPAAANKAEEVIPEARAKLVSAMKILPSKPDRSEVFFTAVKKEVLDEFVNLFESMEMNVIGITIESIGAYGGLADELKNKDTLLLDIGARTTIASIFDRNGIRDSINIPIAGNQITDALVAKLGISHTDAEDRKMQIGMDPAVMQGEVMWIIQGQMQPVADELKKFINYYEETSGQKLEQLVMTGGTAQLAGLDKYFGDNLNLPTVLAKPFLKDKHLPERLNSTKFINALGLAKLALQKKWDVSFYQTERLALQQTVTVENFMIWLRVIGRFFLRIPDGFKKVLQKWYLVAPILLILAGLVLWQYKDRFLNAAIGNQQTISAELVVSDRTVNLDNYLPGDVIVIQQSLDGNFAGFTYTEAEKLLKKELFDRAIAQANTDSNLTASVIPQIYSVKNVKASPSESEFLRLRPEGQIGANTYQMQEKDVLTVSADFQFLSINNLAAKALILSDLPLPEAQKLNNWAIISVNHRIIDFEEIDDFFRLDTEILLAAPVQAKPRYWPF